MHKHPTRCGYVALIGAPNAGKSTLLNALVGTKLSIVTPKPQTTRMQVRGVACEGPAQFVFVDTPGIFDAKPAFERTMVEAAWASAAEADALLLVVDAARGMDDDTRRIAEALKARGKKPIVVLNKVDKVEKPRLPELAQALDTLCDAERVFMVSSKKGGGVRDIARYLASRMPEAEWLYPEDTLTDMNERDIAAEITREECFLRLHAELPYGLTVEAEQWQEKSVKGERVAHIRQTIVTERESHKKIILGNGGAMLKAIGSAARRKIGAALGCQAHLFLFVKVRAGWKDDAHKERP